MTLKNPFRMLPAALALSCLLMLAACAMPRLVIMDDPLSPEEHLQLGRSYEQAGQYGLAEKEYRAAARKLPEAHFFLGNLFFEQEDFGRAEDQYREAIRQAPEDPRPLNNLAWLLLTRKEHLDEAEKLARRALELAADTDRAVYRDTLERVLEARKEAGP